MEKYARADITMQCNSDGTCRIFERISHGFRDLEVLVYLRRVLARVSNEQNVRFEKKLHRACEKIQNFFEIFFPNRTLRYHTYF